LRTHTDFFITHPDVLRDIEITHSSGSAVSLLERQVAALREDKDRLKDRFEELVALAKSNEDLIKRIHRLALALMEAVGPEAIFATLADTLAREFSADSVRTLIFANPSFVESSDVPEFVGADCAAREEFAELVDNGSPRCGQLTDGQNRSLFDGGAQRGSAALLPLSGKSWDGLLVVASDDEARFDENMGTEFLAYLGDIVSLIVDPWVARSVPG
jgi:hypothetical protein